MQIFCYLKSVFLTHRSDKHKIWLAYTYGSDSVFPSLSMENIPFHFIPFSVYTIPPTDIIRGLALLCRIMSHSALKRTNFAFVTQILMVVIKGQHGSNVGAGRYIGEMTVFSVFITSMIKNSNKIEWQKGSFSCFYWISCQE